MPGKFSHGLLPATAGFFHDVGDAVGDKISVGETRAYGIDSDTSASEFQRERAHQANYRMLCRAISADIGIALKSGGRRNRDNPSVRAPFHRRQTGLDSVNHPHKIDV